MHRLLFATICAAAACQAGGGSTPTEPAVFRGGPDHPGTAEASGVPDFGRIAWRFQTGGTVRSSPILVDSVLYVGSSDGRLYALDAGDGAERWRFDAGAAVASAPAVAGTLVYVANRSNVLIAVDRSTGRERWRKETGPDLPLAWGWEGWDYITSSPTLADGVLLYASGNGVLYALDPDSGRERWTHAAPRRFRATPAVAGGTVYLGGGDGVFRALDLPTGAERWTFRTAGADLDASQFGFDRTQIQSSAAVRDGVVYFGSRDASLYALDARTGDSLWTQVDGSSWVSASPVVLGDLVMSGRSSSTRVHGVDRATGAVRWTATAGGLVIGSPTAAGSTLYVGTGTGRLLALDVATGAERWRLRLGQGIYGAPAVGDGRLYVGDDDGAVYAIETTDRPPPERLVYWDEQYRSASFLGSAASHRTLVDYLLDWGYREIGAAALARVMDSVVATGTPTVVVMAMDYLPTEVLGDETAPGPFRRYLDAGGKVVWLGYPPRLFVRDSVPGRLDIDRARPTAIVGVDHSAFDTDTYQAQLTDEGRLWGLETWWRGGPSARADAVTGALALDEIGRAVAWFRSYGGPPGTGYVYLPLHDRARMAEVRQVADYGVLRAP